MLNKHPYIRYAQALLIVENNLKTSEGIESGHITEEIRIGLDTIRVKPNESFEGKENVKFVFDSTEKGAPKEGLFLSPHVIAKDDNAHKAIAGCKNILSALKSKKSDSSEKASMSISPLTGEFLSFSMQGKIGRGKADSSVYDMGLSAVTTLTRIKPSLQNRGENTCVIPDLPIDDMVDFVKVFKDMLNSKSTSDLMIGRVKKEEKKTKTKVDVTYKPVRPTIFYGNFPNPPKSGALGSISLLATIGEFAKEAEFSERCYKVLDSLESVAIYLIRYGDASIYYFNHHVIELARLGKLREIVDSIYYSKLYNQSRRDYKNTEYQKFDLFSSRFLQLFNKPAFKDFLAFRAEYPHQIELLLNTYFIKMENIDSKIVTSARHLGKWLNSVAYFVAKVEVKEGDSNYWEKLRERKAKVLVELESSTFSAKTGDALISQAVTRAGRLSGMDAPEEATLFMEKTMCGELQLDQAKNLLIAFSRLKGHKEDKINDESKPTIENKEEGIYADV